LSLSHVKLILICECVCGYVNDDQIKLT
jgi:hypothetical protein